MVTKKFKSRVVGFEMVDASLLEPHPDNVRQHPKAQVVAFRSALSSLGFAGVILARKVGKKYQILDGHMRVGVLDETLPTVILDLDDNEARTFLMSFDPMGRLAAIDMVKLQKLLKALPTKLQATVRKSLNLQEAARQLDEQRGVQKDADRKEHQERAGSLVENFGAPPFTVLDARQGYWQDRKREWLALGLRGVAGREDIDSAEVYAQEALNVVAGGQVSVSGTSVFDPVLCELMYRWFCPPAGRIFDPFAGELTKGYVAGALGYEYVGIELRQEQIDANLEQLPTLGVEAVPPPKWIQGDSAQLDKVMPKKKFDMVFTSPPYYDLEIYQGGAADVSALPSYREFMEWYSLIFAKSKELLKKNRFLILKLGEIRDKQGGLRGFVADNVKLFADLGLTLYNDAILVTPVGTLPFRAGRIFKAGRKLARGHQYVMIWYNGDVSKVKQHISWDVYDEDA